MPIVILIFGCVRHKCCVEYTLTISSLLPETAINIGYSSKLLVEDMRVFIINADDRAGVQQQLNDAR